MANKEVVQKMLKLLLLKTMYQTHRTPKLLIIYMFVYICAVLRNLVPFLQFKTREKHPWRSVSFIKATGFSLQIY